MTDGPRLTVQNRSVQINNDDKQASGGRTGVNHKQWRVEHLLRCSPVLASAGD